MDILKEILLIEKDIVDLLKVGRLTYFGHMNRMGNDRFEFQRCYSMATHMDIEENQKRNV